MIKVSTNQNSQQLLSYVRRRIIPCKMAHMIPPSTLPDLEALEAEFNKKVNFEISPIKKERINKERKRILREALRLSLPVLTPKEIRRYRLPYHEAILAELYEGDLESTAEFIMQLIEFQDQNRRKFGPGTVIWMRPQLVNSQEELDRLTNALSKAETAHKEGDLVTETEEMLRLAAHYAFSGTDDWWWLGEQVLYQCVSMHFPPELKKQECIAYFIIGKYLVENGKKTENGKYYLELAREMSLGKSWSCRKVLDTKQDTVFIESCRLLYKVLMEEARFLLVMHGDSERGIELSVIARKRAAESCNQKGEIEAFILKGKFELQLNRAAEAIATITKALNRSMRRQSVSDICEAKISLALGFLQHGKIKESLDCLNEITKLGHDNSMPFYVAQSYRYMGEHFLKQKKPYEATPLLMLAFYLFHEHGDLERREKVRTWAAISAGEELFPAYIKLIKKCTGEDTVESSESLIKLIRWLDEREFFWTQQSKFSFSYTSLRESVGGDESLNVSITESTETLGSIASFTS